MGHEGGEVDVELLVDESFLRGFEVEEVVVDMGACGGAGTGLEVVLCFEVNLPGELEGEVWVVVVEAVY